MSSSKVAIIGFNSLNYMPYVKKYMNILDKYNIDYDVICWDRNNLNNSVDKSNIYEFSSLSPLDKIRILKINDFYKYREYVIELLNKNRYKKIIVTTTILAMLLKDYLIKNYKNNYIFDIRDYTYERNIIYKKYVQKIIENSYFTVISSKGYLTWLPKSNKYIINHNISNQYKIDKNKYFANDTIDISFFGITTFLKSNRILIKNMNKYENISISYYGESKSIKNIKKYVEKKKLNRINFYGVYDNDLKAKLYRNADFINALYDTNNMNNKTLLPNKLYDSVYYRIPIIANKNSFLAQVINQYNLGITIDLKTNFEKDILKYIEEFDYKEYEKNCNKFIDKLEQEENIFVNKLYMYILD